MLPGTKFDDFCQSAKLRTPDEEIVQLPAAKAVIEEVVFFSVKCKTYDEICSICSYL